MTHVVLVGNPNCGKTTLFNALTGENQRIGNWPGVTVEKKTGQLTHGLHTFHITDLPGVYSMSSGGYECGQDQHIATKAIMNMTYDVIINVVDACQLERHLYLTSQLLEIGKPMIVVLNMMDLAKQRGIHIQVSELSRYLGCPVLPIQAHQRMGLGVLKQSLLTPVQSTRPLSIKWPEAIGDALEHIQTALTSQAAYASGMAFFRANRLLEGDGMLTGEDLPALQCLQGTDSDILAADARYQAIHDIVERVQTKNSDASEHFTAKLDRLVLNRFAAIPIFLGVMYIMFVFAIHVGGIFQDCFDITTETLFVRAPAFALSQIHAPAWLIAIVANGLGKGINTTLTFIPVISAMFFFLAFLEASGYMARAAFVVDKAMRALGLPGKSFVPMIVGFGCNVPAIMAARSLDSERDRLLTVLMSPFMSCSARLAIFTVFVAAFFPSGGQNVVFALYLIGILLAVLTGFMLRKTLLKGASSSLILELPAYHRPNLKRLLKETGARLKFFVHRAGRLIIPVCMVLGALNALTLNGALSTGEANTQSLLSYVGQALTPFFVPMGIHADNWPATVGLMTGMLAKEVVVGSLNSLYAQIGHLGEMHAASFDLWGSLSDALWSIPENILALPQALFNPILASAPDSDMSASVYGMMASRFDGQAGAFAYMLFILLYVPCVSTVAAIRQEASRKWMWFSVAWSLLIAYSSAVLFYQCATFTRHPQQSSLWLLGVGLAIAAFVWMMCRQGFITGDRHVVANP